MMPNNNSEGRNQYTKNRTHSDQHQKSTGQDAGVQGKRDSDTRSEHTRRSGVPHDRDIARDDADRADEAGSSTERRTR
jgi:hypothetical protein